LGHIIGFTVGVKVAFMLLFWLNKGVAGLLDDELENYKDGAYLCYRWLQRRAPLGMPILV
jgi:hypothetical protein